MSTTTRAYCPLCVKPTPMFVYNERRIFEHHYVATVAGNSRDVTVCEASGWLVEDCEVIG